MRYGHQNGIQDSDPSLAEMHHQHQTNVSNSHHQQQNQPQQGNENAQGEGNDSNRAKSLLSASDHLMHLSESFMASPSSLFPEIYRSMAQFSENQAAGSAGDNNDGEDDDGSGRAGRVFRWPTIASRESDNAPNISNNGE